MLPVTSNSMTIQQILIGFLFLSLELIFLQQETLGKFELDKSPPETKVKLVGNYQAIISYRTAAKSCPMCILGGKCHICSPQLKFCVSVYRAINLKLLTVRTGNLPFSWTSTQQIAITISMLTF